MELLDCLVQIKPTISKIRWDKDYDFLPCEFKVDVKTESMEGSGRSLKIGDSSLSLYVAFVEACERIVCKYNNLETSNGVAGHTSTVKSIINAENEYCERLVFLSKFYSGDLNGTELPVTRILKSYFSKKEKVEIKNVLLGICNLGDRKNYVVMSVCRLNKSADLNGVIVGLGTSSSIEIAIEKAELENIQMTNYFWQKEFGSMTLNEFGEKNEISFEDHGRLALSPSYFKLIERIFSLSHKKSSIFEPVIETTKTELDVPQGIDESRLRFFRANSIENIQLFSGFPQISFLKSLEIFLDEYGLKLDREAALLPHPLA